MRIIAVSLAALIGCSNYEDPRPVAKPDQITASVSYTIHGDTECLPSVRADCENSCRDWATVSRWHISFKVLWDLTPTTLFQYQSEPLILCRPHVFDRGEEVCGGITGNIIEISTAPICNTKATALHELGHLAGIPSIADPGAAMNNSSQLGRITGADIRACAAVGLCPSLKPKDVTTVTVTVDPRIPNVEPDYPKALP